MTRSGLRWIVFSAAFSSLIYGASFAQPSNDNKEQAFELEELLDWCSKDAQFTNAGSSDDNEKASCLKNGPNYNVWFKFRASTELIQIVAKTGGAKGTMKFAYLGLFEEQGTALACDEYKDEQGDVGIVYNNLNLGNWYYISVDHPYNPKYNGSFTLCVNDELGYDYRDGATELLNLSNWCSANAAFTTKGASPDGNPAPCLRKGPNYNRWFKFYARTNEIEVKVMTGGEQGTMKFPNMTLWDAGAKPIRCVNYLPASADECVLKYSGLKKSYWYYISVDHPYKAAYLGSFTLCLNKGGQTTYKNSELISIKGRLLYNLFDPVESQVYLKDDQGRLLNSTSTDKYGKFEFNELSPNMEFILVVDKYEPSHDIAIVQTNFDGKIIKQAYRDKGNIFGFKALPQDCHYIALLDCEEPGMLPNEGTVGIVGKIVEKGDPMGGKKNINVYLYDSPQNLLDSTETDEYGKFKFNNLPFGEAYLVRLQEGSGNLYLEMLMVNDKGKAIMASSMGDVDENGFFHFVRLEYMTTHLKLAKTEEIKLIDMEEGASVQLNNIYFEPGKHQLLAESSAELNLLVGILMTKSDIKIEISGHTDNIGTKQFNLVLSEKRAKSVVDYLVTEGISESRLTYKGFGSLKPLSRNNTEYERQKNRRVEFKVIK
ncbi:MAG: hypothetical protein COB85_02910 [Bacteroidetes bacterium]|nr:MAG: hypothetical protein COB85_02910 [Bacteroidota bacterium]